MLKHKELEPFGVEIDLHIGCPLTRSVIDEIRALYQSHHLVVFRNQALTIDQQVDFVGHFGPILNSPADGIGYISNVPGQGNLGDTELAFHSDLSFSPKPYLGISLHAVDCEPGASATRFVDSVAAWERLPEDRQAALRNCHAMQVMGVRLDRRNLEDSPDFIPRTVHPLAMRHPVTGETILYVNYNQTARIVELSADESEAAIKELFAHIYRPEAQYVHQWKNGDVVLWDNLAVQHARDKVSGNVRRTLQRVVVAEAGFYEQHPEFKPEQFETSEAGLGIENDLSAALN